MDEQQKHKIELRLKDCLRNKMSNYNPETKYMPFHTRLLGKDRMALFSFIQSLNTTFGNSIYEPVARELSIPKFKSVSTQVDAGNKVYSEAQEVIQKIINGLNTSTNKPDKESEIEQIREVCKKGELVTVKYTKVDIKLVSNNDEIYLIDIKSVKPNIGEFKGYKRTLLEWVATTLEQNPEAKINTLLAIPYNPYEPEPYERWTMAGMIDLKYELKVANEFWDFLGGEGAYIDLLDIFEKVGIELRDEIDEYFKNVKS